MLSSDLKFKSVQFPRMECGLVFVVGTEPVPVPLKSVSVKTRLVDFVAEVTVEQTYVNQVSPFLLRNLR